MRGMRDNRTLPNVRDLKADELHRQLVADVVQGIATNLRWAIAAYQRIGTLTGKGAEWAYQQVRDEAAELRGGYRGMPVA